MSRELFFWHSVQSPFTFCRFPKRTKAALAECAKGSDNFFVWKPILVQNGRVQAKKLAGSLAFSDSDANFA